MPVDYLHCVKAITVDGLDQSEIAFELLPLVLQPMIAVFPDDRCANCQQ